MNRHARLIWDGSAGLWWRYCRWLGNGPWRTVAGRLLGTVALGWMVGGMLVAAPGLMWPVTAAWLVAAWRTGRTEERQERNELAFVQLVRNLIADRNGVLLAEVAAVLQERNPAVTIGHVREQCEALDIPVRDRLKVDGRVSVGVHVEDLTAVWGVQPSAPPPTPSREWHASVTSDNYPTTSDGEPSGGGDSCTMHESGGEVNAP